MKDMKVPEIGSQWIRINDRDGEPPYRVEVTGMHQRNGYVTLKYISPALRHGTTTGYDQIRHFNAKASYRYQPVESYYAPPPSCPQCEENPVADDDYLCRRCRWGV